MNKLPEMLKKLRTEKGLSQQELSIALNIPRTTISSWESGSRIPELATLEKLADFFKVSIDYLLGRVDIQSILHKDYAVQNLYKVIKDDPELTDFIEKLTYRDDLHTISKKIKDLSSNSVHKLIGVIDALEMDKDSL